MLKIIGVDCACQMWRWGGLLAILFGFVLQSRMAKGADVEELSTDLPELWRLKLRQPCGGAIASLADSCPRIHGAD